MMFSVKNLCRTSLGYEVVNVCMKAERGSWEEMVGRGCVMLCEGEIRKRSLFKSRVLKGFIAYSFCLSASLSLSLTKLIF